jgi:GDP-mannose 6-dehydrogenase
MRISIFGLGYVGAVSLACLARDGHDVTGADIDEHKLALIRRGQSPIVEEGIQSLMASVVGSGRVTLTQDAASAVAASELSFVCVGTPPLPNGSQDLRAIERLAEQIGNALRVKSDYHLIVVRSTVRPGTLESLIKPILERRSGKQAWRDFGLAFQPEFLREGSSIRDYDQPPFTVIGTPSERDAAMLRELFGHLPCEFVHTQVGTAEMLKYACNSFHALKVTYANEIARLGKKLGVDAREVMRLLCQDTRLNISPAYLRPGFAFGGSCLPKDLKALLYLAKESDVELPMLQGVLPSNREHIERAVEMVLATGKRAVGMAGLSFKQGTDDLRESPLVILAERFIGKGLNLKIYDPDVQLARLMGANRRYIEETIPHIASVMCADAQTLVEHAEVLVLGQANADVLAAVRARGSAALRLIDLVDARERLGPVPGYDGLGW